MLTLLQHDDAKRFISVPKSKCTLAPWVYLTATDAFLLALGMPVKACDVQ